MTLIRLGEIMRKKVTAHTVKREETLEQSTILEITPTGSFSIITHMYESELDKKYGIVLRDLKNGERRTLSRKLRQNVIFNRGYHHPPKKIKRAILDQYRDIPGFCSMALKTETELLAHARRIHEVSYSHYAWAKENDLEYAFPYLCCGRSTRNLLLNLMTLGYPNATGLYNDNKDHAYVALPFILGQDKQGFVVVDPTSDQLFRNKETAPRNNLFVVFGSTWEYRTNWATGQDLYPREEDNSTYGNLYTLRKNVGEYIEFERGIGKYFKEVFENPVQVKANLS